MPRTCEALEILLPDADDVSVRRARSVTQFLRLLSDDAEPAHAGTIGVDLERARLELERADRADLECALVELLRSYLSALTSPDSSAWFGEARAEAHTSWRVLAEFDDILGELGRVPDPRESSADVARRLMTSLERIEITPARASLWRARVAHVTDGARTAERMHRAALAERDALTPTIARQHLAGVVECLLDRGQARDARGLLAEHTALVANDVRLRQLCAWVRLCLEDVAGAKSVLVGLPPWTGPVPIGLIELREQRPEWLPCLAGRSAAATARVGRDAGAERDHGDALDADRSRPIGVAETILRQRQAVGAAVVCIFTFRAWEGARVHAFDSAPGLKARAETWLAERLDAYSVAGEIEHQVVATARTVVRHKDPAAPLRGVLGLETTRAVVVAPILDAEGEVAGWIHVECEHHWLPSRARCEDMARAWRTGVLVSRARARDDIEGRAISVGAPDARATDASLAQVFQDWIAALGMKLHLRHWWGFTLEGREPRLVDTGGEGVGLARGRAGCCRALSRAIATGGAVVFDERDERLSILHDSASGCVLPLLVEGRICGLLAIESSRRRDFRAKDIESAALTGAQHALALRAAQFRAWHARRFGFAPWLRADAPGFEPFAFHLIKVARARSALAITGPRGAGKLVSARWVHFEGAHREGPFKVFSCATPLAATASFPELLDSARDGTLVLDDVERLAPALQEELVRWLDGVERAQDRGRDSSVVRVIATTTCGLDAAARSGSLRHDLARRLDRWTMSVPALRERRAEIPGLALDLTRRFAAEEKCATPSFADDTLALLWRQPWEGNVRELENVVYKLVLLRPGAVIGPADVFALREIFGLEIVRKLPSRHPDRRDLLAALWTTRKTCGRANKTRAALYLGWDPDTLVARLASERIDPDRLETLSSWTHSDPARSMDDGVVEHAAEDDEAG